MTKNTYKHQDIVNLILKHTCAPGEKQEKLSKDDLEDFRQLLFLNKHTLQLSRQGLNLLSNIFESFTINLPENYKLRSRDLITLDRECRLPYYINAVTTDNPRIECKGHVVLFEKELALILKLYDGDLDMVREMPRDGTF